MVIASAFGHVYNENWKPKAEQKNMKILQLGQKSLHKFGAKEVMAAVEISTFEKKSDTFLHQENRKEPCRHLRNFQIPSIIASRT
jgi:hypothetical protein